MDSTHFKISNGVLAQCLMSGKEDVTVTIPDGVTSIGLLLSHGVNHWKA